jgi:tRNA pseudouridine55 synthase
MNSTRDGLLILDKPAGMTSARAVAIVKQLLPRGTKVGHAGTLDSFATGVLILLLGRATRRCEEIMSWPKTYEATIRLGATTATDDPESPPLARMAQPVPPEVLQKTLGKFVGTIQQRPPVYSALKIAGKRSSDRARTGQSVRPEPRAVRVYAIKLLSYEWPMLNLRIDCGRGTYIRSIARDLGEHLGVGGYLTSLRRTRIGECHIEQGVRIDRLSAQNISQHIRAR